MTDEPYKDPRRNRGHGQADCYAGVWAHGVSEFGALEDGDFNEAMTVASSVGDDKLQQQSQGYAVPDSFTHGSAAQRMTWFKRGYDGGNPNACDSFSGNI